MCGIAGIVADRAVRFRPVVEAMLATIAHRGPDGNEVIEFDGCLLGAVRLAIVDVAHGRQPMVRADGAVGVAFNGEVYGHEALRSRCPGFAFRTGCDTEVLLASHARDGDDFVDRLPGMFAFALWDEGRRRLICGRDRLGEKPFYWLRGPENEVAFASEIKALEATGWLDPVVDEGALAYYLRHGFVHPRGSIYRDVQVLPPAHRLVVAGTKARAERYWTPPAPSGARSMDEAADALRRELGRAVDEQLEADVPVGAFLSGGVDSSTVAALAAERHPRIHTFSFGFPGPGDETAYARRQSEWIGTRHHTFGPGDLDVVGLLRELPRIYDEPFGDSSAIPTLLLSRATRDHVKVALTGDGADELLGGYLFWAREHLRRSGVRLPPALGGRSPSRLRRHRQRLGRSYVGFRSYLGDDELTSLGVEPDFRADVDATRLTTGTLADLLRYDLDTYLPGDILVKTDRASMSTGLELRSPFLDHRVVELCLSFPDALKVDEHREKLVLRAAFESLWDPMVSARAKAGFGAPFTRWLGEPEVASLVTEVTREGSRIFDLVDGRGVTALTGGTGQATWNLLMLALWAEEHPGARR